MAFTFAKIFKPEPSAVAKLRLIDQSNQQDLKFPGELSDKGQFARENYHARLVAFSGKMCIETAEDVIAAHLTSLTVPAWDELVRHSLEMIQGQILERTREPLVAALRATCETLEAAMDRVTKASQNEGEKMGVEIGESDSPIFRALAAKHQTAKDFMAKFSDAHAIAYGSYGQLQEAVQFVLS